MYKLAFPDERVSISFDSHARTRAYGPSAVYLGSERKRANLDLLDNPLRFSYRTDIISLSFAQKGEFEVRVSHDFHLLREDRGLVAASRARGPQDPLRRALLPRHRTIM